MVSETLVPPTGGPETPDTSDPVAVARETIQDLFGNPVGYLLTGLAYFGVVLAVVFVAVAAMGLGIAPGVALENDVLLTVGGIIGGTIYLVAIFACTVFVYPMMTASLMLGFREQRAGGAAVGLRNAFDRARDRMGPIVRLYLLIQALALVGMIFLYIPGLIVLAVGMLAMPIVVFENVGAVEAMQLAWAHARKHVGWHVGVWLIMLAMLVAVELTVVGIFVLWPLMCCYQVIAYEKAFGAEGARLTVAKMEGRL